MWIKIHQNLEIDKKKTFNFFKYTEKQLHFLGSRANVLLNITTKKLEI